ncbi:Calcium channel [Dirofilaria immitis]
MNNNDRLRTKQFGNENGFQNYARHCSTIRMDFRFCTNRWLIIYLKIRIFRKEKGNLRRSLWREKEKKNK